MNGGPQVNARCRRVRSDGHGLIRILTIPLGLVWFATAGATSPGAHVSSLPNLRG